jgi:hypothetical protein
VQAKGEIGGVKIARETRKKLLANPDFFISNNGPLTETKGDPKRENDS